MGSNRYKMIKWVCDRCGAQDEVDEYKEGTTTPKGWRSGFGVDLCNKCLRQFEKWMKLP